MGIEQTNIPSTGIDIYRQQLFDDYLKHFQGIHVVDIAPDNQAINLVFGKQILVVGNSGILFTGLTSEQLREIALPKAIGGITQALSEFEMPEEIDNFYVLCKYPIDGNFDLAYLASDMLSLGRRPGGLMEAVNTQMAAAPDMRRMLIVLNDSTKLLGIFGRLFGKRERLEIVNNLSPQMLETQLRRDNGVEG